MKILILGNGQIATAVVNSAPPGHEIVVRTHEQLDIVDFKAVAGALAEIRADWIINAAAYTSVDRAEDERSEARAVNDAAVRSLASGAARECSRLLHLSTDFVFDGRSGKAYLTDDRTDPLNVYGVTKRAGEHHVLALPTGIVLRTSWVYASIGRNFVLTMLRLMNERDHLSVVCDQIGAPTWAMSAAAAIWALIDNAISSGIYHWTDLGVASWFDFAIAIQEEARARGLLSQSIPIVPVRSADYPTRARRPHFSVLDTDSTRSILNITGRHWRHNLRSMLDELRTL